MTGASYGSANTVASLTVDSYGRLTAASNVTIAIAVGQVSGAVPNTRSITAGTGLTGGGDLSADRTLSVTANSTNQKVTIANNGVVTASEPAINFVPGSNVTITTADDAANNRVNVTVGLSAGVLGTMASQNANAVAITGGNVVANVTVLNALSASATYQTSSLPLVPAGYIQIQLSNATVVKVPYYAS